MPAQLEVPRGAGLGAYAFLRGEFDYFLTQQGIGLSASGQSGRGASGGTLPCDLSGTDEN